MKASGDTTQRRKSLLTNAPGSPPCGLAPSGQPGCTCRWRLWSGLPSCKAPRQSGVETGGGKGSGARRPSAGPEQSLGHRGDRGSRCFYCLEPRAAQSSTRTWEPEEPSGFCNARGALLKLWGGYSCSIAALAGAGRELEAGFTPLGVGEVSVVLEGKGGSKPVPSSAGWRGCGAPERRIR